MAPMEQEFKPTFSPAFRTGIYVTGVFLAFATFVTAGIALAMNEPEVAAAAGLVGTGWGGVASSFGVGYRPTRS